MAACDVCRRLAARIEGSGAHMSSHKDRKSKAAKAKVSVVRQTARTQAAKPQMTKPLVTKPKTPAPSRSAKSVKKASAAVTPKSAAKKGPHGRGVSGTSLARPVGKTAGRQTSRTGSGAAKSAVPQSRKAPSKVERHAVHSGKMARASKKMVDTVKIKNSKANGSAPGKPLPVAAAQAKPKVIVLPPGYRPLDTEPFMNERHRLYFRNKLVAWKDEIIRQNMETLQGLHEESTQHADLADRATSETDRALELRARDRQRKLIAKIDSAIHRIEEGSYGYCEETGEPIGLKRLDARPIATMSIEAQERHERRERIFRED